MAGQAKKKPTDFENEPTAGPIRRCAVTRARRHRSDLIRFVAGPDGTVVADLGLKLPGRGVWVSADRASISDLSRNKAFSTGLKRHVEVPENLADELEEQILNRVTSALAMANKAGLVTYGFEKVATRLVEGSVSALIHGLDGAIGGREKLDRKYQAICHDTGQTARIFDCLTVAQMSLAIGRSNVVHAALSIGGTAKRFLSEAERLTRYRAGLNATTVAYSTEKTKRV